MYTGLHVKNTHYYSSQISIRLEFCWHIFQKSSNNKLNENPSSGSWVVPCGQTDSPRDE